MKTGHLKSGKRDAREQAVIDAIAAAMVRLRKSADISQAKLAERVGLTQQTIYNIEHGKSSPSFAYIVWLAEVFNVSVTEFLPEPERRRQLADKLVAEATDSRFLEAAKEVIQMNGFQVVEPKPARRPRKTKAQQ